MKDLSCLCVCACVVCVCVYVVAMHNIFQRDLFRLKLETARSYAKAVTSSMLPITSAQQDESLKITAQVV